MAAAKEVGYFFLVLLTVCFIVFVAFPLWVITKPFAMINDFIDRQF